MSLPTVVADIMPLHRSGVVVGIRVPPWAGLPVAAICVIDIGCSGVRNEFGDQSSPAAQFATISPVRANEEVALRYP